MLVDRAVVLEGHAGVVPLAVRLRPDRPVPGSNRLVAPPLDALPDEFAAAIGKPPPVIRAVKRRLRTREGHHRNRARVENRLNATGERRPFFEWIGDASIKGVDADD